MEMRCHDSQTNLKADFAASCQVPQVALYQGDGVHSMTESTTSLKPAEPLWPDASTEFDTPPVEFPLRRSASDGNLVYLLKLRSYAR